MTDMPNLTRSAESSVGEQARQWLLRCAIFTLKGAPRLVKGQLRKTQKESINILESPRLSARYIQSEGTSL